MAQAQPGPYKKITNMKCDAGVWIDSKQLLEHTNRLVRSLGDYDREVFGKELIRLNIAMIRDFPLAYKLRNEHYAYDDNGTVWDVRLDGHKREYIDRFIADLMAYEALIEFIFDNLNFIGPKHKRKRNRRERFFLTQIAKIETGVEKWSRRVYKQVVVSKKRRGES